MKGLLCVFLVIVLSVSLCSCSENKGEEYLLTFEHNDEVVFIDDHYVYYSDRKINYRERLEKYISIEYICKDYIFYSCYENNIVTLYRADSDFNNSEIVLAYPSESRAGYSTDLKMYGKNTVQYKSIYGKKIYLIDECKEYDYDISLIPETERIYSVEYKGNGSVIITDNRTDKARLISNDNSKAYETEVGRKLCDLGSALSVDWVYVCGEDIYVNFSLSYFTDVVFLYDFEAESFDYVDWNSNTNGGVWMYELK